MAVAASTSFPSFNEAAADAAEFYAAEAERGETPLCFNEAAADAAEFSGVGSHANDQCTGFNEAAADAAEFSDAGCCERARAGASMRPRQMPRNFARAPCP